VRWSVYAIVRGRKPQLDLRTSRYFDVADDPDRSYTEKIDAYLALADEHFESERYAEFCADQLAHLPELVHDWVRGPSFDRMLRETVAATYPAHEQDQFMAHFRGLLAL
jgi:hypothetical protein